MGRNWAQAAIEKLGTGANAVIHPRGSSMHPKVKDGAEVELTPITADTELSKGDIVLVKVKGKVYLHLIKGVRGGDAEFQIGNNRGGINGWTGRQHVYGLAIEVR